MDMRPHDGLSDIWPWITTVLLSAWGGAVQYAQRVRAGEKFDWLMLALDLLISSFAGILTWLLCQSAEIYGPMSAVMIAVSGHMGTRAIASLVAIRERLFGAEPSNKP